MRRAAPRVERAHRPIRPSHRDHVPNRGHARDRSIDRFVRARRRSVPQHAPDRHRPVSTSARDFARAPRARRRHLVFMSSRHRLPHERHRARVQRPQNLIRAPAHDDLARASSLVVLALPRLARRRRAHRERPRLRPHESSHRARLPVQHAHRLIRRVD